MHRDIQKFMEAAPKVMTYYFMLICNIRITESFQWKGTLKGHVFQLTSNEQGIEMNRGMAVEVEPSHQYPIPCCCCVTDGSKGAQWCLTQKWE